VLLRRLSDGAEGLGMAYSPIEDLSHGDSKALLEALGRLNVSDACSLTDSPYPVVKSLLVAYLNALTTFIYDVPPEAVGKDVLDVMGFSRDDVVVVVGYIGPVVKGLKGRVRKVLVLERNPRRRGQALPDTSAPRVLPKASKVVVTGATLVNDTLDSVLELVPPDAEVALVGATASVHPEPLFRHGVSVVAGFRFSRGSLRDAVRAVRVGCGTSEVYGMGFKYAVTRRSGT